MKLRDFIADNQAEIDLAIERALTRYDKPGFNRIIRLDDVGSGYSTTRACTTGHAEKE